jgi:hypothetical protein
VVAIANKHARMIWAILAKGEDYDPDAWRRWTRSAPADERRGRVTEDNEQEPLTIRLFLR